MRKLFVFLEKKRLSRSNDKTMNTILVVFKWIAIVYFGLLFLLMGMSGFFIIEDMNLGMGSPIQVVSRFWMYYMVMEMFMRFTLQKLPTASIKPLLVLPFPKIKIVNFYIGSSFISAFNFIQLLFILPFAIVSIVQGYSVLGVIAWMIAVYLCVCTMHFVNILIESYKSVFIAVIVVFGLLAAIQYYQLFDSTLYTQHLLYSVYEYPALVLVYGGVLWLAIKMTVHYYAKNMYMDDLLKVKVEVATTREMKWLDGFGTYASFLKNDLRLITRNKRARTTVLMSVLFMFYGFFILRPTEMGGYPTFILIFVAFFVSGGFLMMFGQYVPSWDSSYYSFMMTQNITYKNYLKSKWLIIALGTGVSMLAAVLYIWTSMDLVYLIIANGVFNIGINGYIVLWGGAYLKSPVDLTANKNVFADKNAFNLRVMLISLPKLFLPILIYYIGFWVYGFWGGFTLLTSVGIIGMFFQNLAFKYIEKIYKQEKYSTIEAFKSK
ncbi:DUF5687 family protein [Myroides odoratimimus]|uniref:DUF5687 family protein n=1 Tax=Myroides odoratimimus TaxID=76832 RepID=UPI00103F7CF2|nr:DUF5687 family protein [Myroides odoratimimus]MDM1494545.1 hypothetical protein [Myroides odoratimimus]QBK75825.1 hypothetical protein E0Z07_05545 [Myroides odoratimimus]WHT74537.1 DUF5687 family protein [Myroides odoratimimus]WHU39119.1 DUF5687 family protein [Myroides odoratimimus]